jgi:hypothetical protein
MRKVRLVGPENNSGNTLAHAEQGGLRETKRATRERAARILTALAKPRFFGDANLVADSRRSPLGLGHTHRRRSNQVLSLIRVYGLQINVPDLAFFSFGFHVNLYPEEVGFSGLGGEIGQRMLV